MTIRYMASMLPTIGVQLEEVEVVSEAPKSVIIRDKHGTTYRVPLVSHSRGKPWRWVCITKGEARAHLREACRKRCGEAEHELLFAQHQVTKVDTL